MYTAIVLGTNLSEYVTDVEEQHDQMRSYERSNYANRPTALLTGVIWNRTDHATLGDSLERWNGAAWTTLLDPEATQINASGTVAWGANQPMGGFILTGLGAGSANGHSVRYEQVMLTSGANPMVADMNMGGKKITNQAEPTNGDHSATLNTVKGLIPETGFFTLDGSGNSSTSTIAQRPEALLVMFYKTGYVVVPYLISGTAPGTTTHKIAVYDVAGAAWSTHDVDITFSATAPYVSVAAGAFFAGFDMRYVAHNFN